jgi:hypothetical protein
MSMLTLHTPYANYKRLPENLGELGGYTRRNTRDHTASPSLAWCALYFVLCTLYVVLCILYFVLSAVYFVLCTLYFRIFWSPTFLEGPGFEAVTLTLAVTLAVTAVAKLAVAAT